MSKVLAIELPDETFQAVQQLAASSGRTPEETARECIESAVDHNLIVAAWSGDRRAFMRLPMEERRRILAAQAEKLVSHYEEDTEWREWLAGDLVEY